MLNFALQILGPCRDGDDLKIGEIDLVARDEVDALMLANGAPVPPGGKVKLFEKDARTGQLVRLVHELDWAGATASGSGPQR
jgi:hypothetical protein